MSEFVRVFTTNNPNEAEIVKNALEAAGIECFAEGEQQAGFSGLFDIDLVVPRENAEAARKILSEVPPAE